jgi:hypothetical protein
MTAIDRFMKYVEPEPNSGCWLWVGAWGGDGYGYFRIGRRLAHSQRMSYELFRGPLNGLWALHKCDNPPCVNPDHLFLGTQDDNMDDSARKGRQQRGSRHWQAKLTEDDVRAIRALRAEGTKPRTLSEMFSIDTSQISRICSRHIWRHI